MNLFEPSDHGLLPGSAGTAQEPEGEAFDYRSRTRPTGGPRFLPVPGVSGAVPAFFSRNLKLRPMRALLCLILVLSAPGHAIADSTLETILAALTRIEMVRASLLALNIAETAGDGVMSSPRYLQPGDTVVIGYSGAGVAVFATADEMGLTVTQAQAQSIGAGVPPGFYPAGSPLFALPPGVQYSLFSQDQSARRLSLAYELIQARVDGSVYNQVRVNLPRDLADVAAVALNADRIVAMAQIDTTALGAVNTGQIVTDILLRWDPDALGPEIDLALAEVARGHDAALDMANTTTARALHRVETSVIGAQGSAPFMANIASNRMAVSGAVRNIAVAVSLNVDSITTTVLGSVNGGFVRAGD